MRHYNIPVFISHFGCPNSCVFCNQKKINGRETDVSLEDLKKIIDNHLETLPKNSIKQVAFFGGTFTGISMDLQKQYLEVVKEYIDKGLVQSIRLSTRPDCINIEILEQLKNYGVKTIELGLQSLDPIVLAATDRRYNEGVVEESCKLIKEFGFELGAQQMIGLPLSTFENDFKTAKKILDLKPDLARIYPTLVVSGTELERMYKRGEYNSLTIEEAVERTIKIYCLFELNNINIIRVGLQPSEDLTAEGVVIAGPFHPAFRDLVETKIFYNFLSRIYETEKKLKIEANEKNISKIVGQKGQNKKKFYPNFEIQINNNLKLEEIVINNKKYFRKDILEKEVSNETPNFVSEKIRS